MQHQKPDQELKKVEAKIMLPDVAYGGLRALDGFRWRGYIPHDEAPMAILTHLSFAQAQGGGYFASPLPKVQLVPLGSNLLESIEMMHGSLKESVHMNPPLTRYIQFLHYDEGISLIKYSNGHKVTHDHIDPLGCYDFKNERYASPPKTGLRDRVKAIVMDHPPEVLLDSLNTDRDHLKCLVFSFSTDKAKTNHASCHGFSFTEADLLGETADA